MAYPSPTFANATINGLLNGRPVGISEITPADAIGFVGDGTTANDAAWNAWVASRVPGSGLQFGAGTYVFTSTAPATIALGSGKDSVSIFGLGSNNTTLKYTNAAISTGIKITFGSASQNNYHLRDFTMVTTHVNVGIGIDIVGVGQGFNPPMSDIQNVNVQGADLLTPTPGAGTEYWATAVYIHETQQTLINNLNTFGLWGTPGNAGGGIGLRFEGATSNYATILNSTNSSFNGHAQGVFLGDWWQGVTFSLCNWNLEAGTAGIFVAPGAAGELDLLNINQCQFNVAGTQISLNSLVTDLLINNNVISVYGTNGSGIDAGAGASQATIIGNVINWTGTGTSTTGIFINGGGTGIILGNPITNLTTGIDLSATTSGYTVLCNSYPGCTNTVINSGGGANHVGVATQ